MIIILFRFEGLDSTNSKEMESSVGALLAALHSFYLKWEAKLQQIQVGLSNLAKNLS
jgi:hypothetical protein